MEKGFKKSNGVYYTNKIVADFMIDLLNIDYKQQFRLIELAVGEGHIFIHIIDQFMRANLNLTHNVVCEKLKRSFYGFDKSASSVDKCKSNLSEHLFTKYNIIFNDWSIYAFDILDDESIHSLGEFDYIISNPPYISRRNILDEDCLLLKSKSRFCKKSNFYLYYYFFERTLDLWNRQGKAVLITPNSYIRSKSAESLRTEIISEQVLESVYDFEDNMLFEDATTYTAITVLSANSNYSKVYKGHYDKKYIKYELITDQMSNFALYRSNQQINDYVFLKDIAYISNGLATLNDSVFIVKDNEITLKTGLYYYVTKDSKSFKLPISLFRKAYRPNKPSNTNYFIRIKHLEKIEDVDLCMKYFTSLLDERYMKIYGTDIGRTQGLKFYDSLKIAVPKVANLNCDFRVVEKGHYILAGLYIVLKEDYMHAYEKLCNYLNSKEISLLLRNVSKNYASGYKSVSSIDLQNIKIPKSIMEDDKNESKI